MNLQTLKDAQYRIIGYIETGNNGRQTAKDAQFRILGYYEPQHNATQDLQFRIIGYGNLLPSLILNQEQ